MDALELDLHRMNTASFIAVKPSSIALTPVVRSRTASGGYKDTPQPPRPAQTFRIIELGGNTSPPILFTQDGKQREVLFWLLGEFDVTVEVNDFWSEDGRYWEVADVVRSNLYEMRAMVTERGR